MPEHDVSRDLKVPLGVEAIDWLDVHPAERACVESFVGLMLTELAANDEKGNRPGWLKMDRKEAIGEVHWHASKLAVAAKAVEKWAPWDSVLESAQEDVREFAADVANCALMVLDCMGLLGQRTPDTSTQVDDPSQSALFKINGNGFKVPADPISGASLRRLPTPPLGDEYDLCQEGGPGPDRLIADTEGLYVRPGDFFYSVPKIINAGAPDTSRPEGSTEPRCGGTHTQADKRGATSAAGCPDCTKESGEEVEGEEERIEISNELFFETLDYLRKCDHQMLYEALEQDSTVVQRDSRLTKEAVAERLLSDGVEAMARKEYELHVEEMGFETVWEEETQGHRNIYLDAARERLRLAIDAAFNEEEHPDAG